MLKIDVSSLGKGRGSFQNGKAWDKGDRRGVRKSKKRSDGIYELFDYFIYNASVGQLCLNTIMYKMSMNLGDSLNLDIFHGQPLMYRRTILSLHIKWRILMKWTIFLHTNLTKCSYIKLEVTIITSAMWYLYQSAA